MVHSHAERSSDSVLTTVSLADAVLLVILVIEIIFDLINDFLSEFRKAVFLEQWKHSNLDRSERCRNTEHNSGFAALEFFYCV